MMMMMMMTMMMIDGVMVVAGFPRLRLTLTFPCLHAAPKNAADIGILSYSSFLLRILHIMIILITTTITIIIIIIIIILFLLLGNLFWAWVDCL